MAGWRASLGDKSEIAGANRAAPPVAAVAPRGAPRAAGPGRRGRSRGPPVPIPSLPLAMSRRSPNFPTAATADGRVAAFRRARATPPAPAAEVLPRAGPGTQPDKTRRGEARRETGTGEQIGPAPPGRRRPWPPGLHVARSRRGDEGASHGRSSNPEPRGGESLAENRFAPAATTSCRAE